jgi:hypothetical protein
MDVAHGGKKSCGRENADAGNGHEIPDGGDLIPQALELIPEMGGLGLELSPRKGSPGESLGSGRD